MRSNKQVPEGGLDASAEGGAARCVLDDTATVSLDTDTYSDERPRY